MHRPVLKLLLAFIINIVFLVPVIASESISVPLSDELDVDIKIYPADGNKIILWLACNEGSEGTETRTAEKLSKQGMAVWLPDFLSAHFLPQGPSSIYKIPGKEVAAVIELMSKKHPNKNIYLVAGGRASAPLLRGAVEWEKRPDNKPLKGVILLFPRVNLLEPVPGNEPVYIEAVGLAKSPILILEGERTPNRWGLPHLSAKFKQSSQSVSYSLLPKVRGYFYTRSNKTSFEKALAEKVHEIILSSMTRLDKK